MKLLRRILQLALVAVVAVGTAGATDETLFDLIPPVFDESMLTALSGGESAVRYTHPADALPSRVKSVSFPHRSVTVATAQPGEFRVRIYSSAIQNNVARPNTVLAEATNIAPVNSSGAFTDPPVVIKFADSVELQPGVTYFVAVTMRKNSSAPIGSWEVWFTGRRELADAGVSIEGSISRPYGDGPWTNQDYAPTIKLVGSSSDPLPGRGVATDAIPGGVIFTGIYSPAINDSGNVALRAKFTGTGVNSRNDSGIFLHRLRSGLIAREGDSAQGTSATFAGFGDPVINAEDKVAFYAALQRDDSAVTKLNDQGIWTTLGGSLALAIREGDQAPGLPSGVIFRKISWIHLGKDGLYIGAYAATADGTVKANGIWEFANDTLTKVVATGDTVPTADGPQIVRTLGKPAGAGTGSAQSRVASSSGKLAIVVTTMQRRSDVTVFE